VKILLVHVEDDPERGPWANLPWDQVVDLGLGGMNSYERWQRQFHCPVTSLNALRSGFGDSRQVREILGLGCARLIDEQGLDWWEILSILFTEQTEAVILMQRFAQSLRSGDEVYFSRPSLHASLLEHLSRGRIQVSVSSHTGRRKGIGHYLRLCRQLSATQITDIFWDKYDPGYRFRAHLPRRCNSSNAPVVLLPSAYINVSHTGLAYAQTFPEEDFLLMATRRSGWVENLPPNVSAKWLSCYAPQQHRDHEVEKLCDMWRSLLAELLHITEFRIVNALGCLDDFPQKLRHALAVRDAWSNVLDTEPVQAVLCADDSNPYTRIPLLLARERGLPNLACHHGALDSRYIFKRSHADAILAKGRMEENYLVRCGVRREKIMIGAPANSRGATRPRPSDDRAFRPNILFISEAYEVGSGRGEEFYRDVLPPLADLAINTGRKLIVKLHPVESGNERKRILARILSAQQKKVTRVVDGSMNEELFAGAWFGITVLSTVAMECAKRGIPCFLCKWLEFWPADYIEQFVRFGAGVALNHPGEIGKIPNYLESYFSDPHVIENCWQPADAQLLSRLLASSYRLPSSAEIDCEAVPQS
jgi:hypothetical protein